MNTFNIKNKTAVSSSLHGKEIFNNQDRILKYTCVSPVLSMLNPTPAAKRINDYYSQEAKSYTDYCEQILLPAALTGQQQPVTNSKNSPPGYQTDWQYNVTYNQYPVISLYTDLYQYTGGAHGETHRSAVTWNTRLGVPIKLDELFPGNNIYQEYIKNNIIKQIEQQRRKNNSAFFENYADLVNETFNPDQFYLTEDGLVLFFQQYEIAPYSTGIPVFVIPYESLQISLPVSR